MRGAPVLVVGGGAAGIMAALSAAACGAAVTILEKNDRIGMKILISGGGKCNVTHAGDMESLRRAFRPNEARFLKPAFYRFTNDDIVRLLAQKGIALHARPDGRLFPTNGSARDVVSALKDCLDDAGVTTRLNTAVSAIQLERAPGPPAAAGASSPERIVTGVHTAGGFLRARKVILCVGGSSYPGTGTTGDGWPWVQAAGHTLVKVRAALAPLFFESPVSEWAGVALRDVVLRGRQAGKVFVSWRGDLLFTHRGVSGPCALGISREVAERRPSGPVSVEVDLAPDRSPEQAASDLRDWMQKNQRRPVSAFFEPFLPERLVEPFLQSAGYAAGTRPAHLPQKVRSALVQNLKGWKIGDVQHVPLEKGEVVAGGVSLDEVDPQTMQSRKVAGLYLCGEILDIAGPVGGYNLQAAWSTGWVAGEAAAKDAPEQQPLP